ncbi:hypothetical protein OKW39_003774 [Paraburkholderia sp. MM6662-R1]
MLAPLMPCSPWHIVQRSASVAPRPIDNGSAPASSCGVSSTLLNCTFDATGMPSLSQFCGTPAALQIAFQMP